MNLTESPVEFILSFDGAKDIIWDRLTFKELNHLRACSKGLQKMISDKSEKIVTTYTQIINRKIDHLKPVDPVRHMRAVWRHRSTCFDTGYIVIYNYYHCLTKHSYLLMNSRSHTELQKLMKRLHRQMELHYGEKYVFDTNRYKISDYETQWYSLFELMTGIYLTGKWSSTTWCSLHRHGKDGSSFHVDKGGIDRIEYLQGKLLPSP